MNNKKEIFQKLYQYGIDAAQLSQRQLQEKIIQMYDRLEHTTTENLLLRKQNDDLSLQIKTIDEIFVEANQSLASSLSPRTYHNVCSSNVHQNRQLKAIVLQSCLNSSKSKQSVNFSDQNSQKKQTNQKPNFQKCQNSEHQSSQTYKKTPRNISKPHRNSRFCSDHKIFDKQQTSRNVLQDKIQSQIQNSLNEKIEVLMKQNEIIMKRMNQIEVNFIQKGQVEQENFKHLKNFDDRLTNFSSNITSIQNIKGKKDGLMHPRGLSSKHRVHYSTSNLRSYCPSIE